MRHPVEKMSRHEIAEFIRKDLHAPNVGKVNRENHRKITVDLLRFAGILIMVFHKLVKLDKFAINGPDPKDYLSGVDDLIKQLEESHISYVPNECYLIVHQKLESANWSLGKIEPFLSKPHATRLQKIRTNFSRSLTTILNSVNNYRQ